MATDKITLIIAISGPWSMSPSKGFADHVSFRLVLESELDETIDKALETENPYLVYTLKVNCLDEISSLTCIGSGCTLDGPIDELLSAANLSKTKDVQRVRVIYDDESLIGHSDKNNWWYPHAECIYDRNIVSSQEYLEKYPRCIILRTNNETSLEYSGENSPEISSRKIYKNNNMYLKCCAIRIIGQWIS